MNAISLALVNPIGGTDPAPPPWVADANRYMPAATGTRWPAGFTQTCTAGLNYQCSKLFFGSPDYPTNDFLIPFVGFGCSEGNLAPQETILPNADIASPAAATTTAPRQAPGQTPSSAWSTASRRAMGPASMSSAPPSFRP
ncbi:hypothetical protein GGE16_000908 [Rhizobium leguminosarum]|uniref:Uncharacterized protein n=1 Tax=Rhizobium leguminosarum TaxID=384 RepID=A0AAE2MGW0_RHILE|nr:MULTISPECIES: hypothetical protein [Rhizobium]MBB4288892.1 hypothetical protein [Rhizobium leguminosarum]MBB4295015.1 hypothetical protein [Rhizobium leguminosarum]MBB4306408.1 hypothetical protein [Rhizobium leguminosarum]MBB4418011.1 hypothetical protein [Rhizobium leguminosarum]MBB4432856.1 hypothetical protein [Rhizobium esperanzae]